MSEHQRCYRCGNLAPCNLLTDAFHALAAAGTAPTPPTVDVMALDEETLRRAMQLAWNDFVVDTGCYPGDFTVEGRSLRAEFGRSNFVRDVADWIAVITNRAQGVPGTDPSGGA